MADFEGDRTVDVPSSIIVTFVRVAAASVFLHTDRW